MTRLKERTRQLHVLDNIMRHNIRNELNVIHGRGEQLRNHLEGELEAAADVIVDRAETLLLTSEKSREITAVLSDPRESVPIDIGRVVRDVAESTADDWPDADVVVTGPTRLVVSATESIDAALEELFTNAVLHNDGETPHVCVDLEIDGSWGILRMRDDGPGIPEFDRNVLESGAAIEPLSHGSGLGLWLIYWAITRSGGEIRVEDREPRGTEITIRLPLATDG